MDNLQNLPRVNLSSLNVISTVGRGGRGLVFLVQNASTNETSALKAVSKSCIKKRNSETGINRDPFRRVLFERDVLMSLHHPLLPSLHGFVETDEIFGFIMDYCPGGDMSSLRKRQTEHMFSDESIKFYAAELVLALEYLHKHNIVYRDLKPENILIQESGHIMLVDFDLSIKLPQKAPKFIQEIKPGPKKKRHRHGKWRFVCQCLSFNYSSGVSPDLSENTRVDIDTSLSSSAKSNSFVGTEEYVAPEIIKGDGHDYAVDWWSLGVVMYEMLYGKTPFRGQNRKETFYRILSKETELVGEKTALRDLIGRLLEKDVDKRIGLEEIKMHEFFRGVDWEEILLVGRPPFLPARVEWEERGGLVIDVERCVEDVFGERKEDSEDVATNNIKVRDEDFGVF